MGLCHILRQRFHKQIHVHICIHKQKTQEMDTFHTVIDILWCKEHTILNLRQIHNDLSIDNSSLAYNWQGNN